MQYYTFNAHGDMTQRYDANCNLLKNYNYDAFGIEIDPEPLDSNPFRYCGEYFDRETGELYLRARYYNPEQDGLARKILPVVRPMYCRINGRLLIL